MQSRFSVETGPIVILAGVILFAMMLLISLNSIFRYVFNDALVGLIEVIRLYILVSLIFLPLGYIHKKDKNIRLDLLFDNFSETKRQAVLLISSGLSFLVFLGMLYTTVLTTIEHTTEQSTTVLGFPVYVSWWIMTIGVLALCFYLISTTIEHARYLHSNV